jgi:hypothetical protein
VVPTAGKATVVVLAHPRCPCTRASLAELARLTARIGEVAETWVLFADPTDVSWEESDLWRTAQAIPGVRVLADPGGDVAHAFGAFTSGQVLVYDRDGALVFDGGITPARGHEGDSVGRNTIVAHLLGGEEGSADAAVFGCSLENP